LDCRQLWITLPNNPTGAWLSPEELEPLLAAAAAQPRPPLVVLDEAYVEFAPRTHRLAVDRYPNLLLVRTFSKGMASAAWRLGYLLGDPGLVAQLAALQLPYSIAAASLEALDVALDFSAELEHEIRATTHRRERLAASLTAHRAAPSAANFLYIDPNPTQPLADAGLVIRSLPSCTNAARVGIGTEEEAQRTAAALGGTLSPAAPQPLAHLFVLDLEDLLSSAGDDFLAALRHALGAVAPVAVVATTPHEEVARVLGLSLPLAECASPHLRKLSPEGLLQLADSHRAEAITVVSATVHGARCLREAARLRPELKWCFVAMDPSGAEWAGLGDLPISNSREFTSADSPPRAQRAAHR
jgi:hypothetical protein